MQLPRVLLVDDDRSIARALALALRSSYDIDMAGTGEAGLVRCADNLYDIIILDLNLPDIGGLEVCRQLRDREVRSPILILSAENQVLTKINLLDAGANDYMTKPFSLGELKARLRVLTRDAPSEPKHRCLNIGELCLDRRTHTATRDGHVIILRRKEFALLECLMENAGSVVTRTMLTHHGWQGIEEPWTNTVDVHIKYLRDKLDRPFGRPLIKTIHGLGYKLDAAKAAEDASKGQAP